MKSSHARWCAASLVVGLGFAIQVVSVTKAQDRAELMPFAGETAAEFEARRNGLPAPARLEDPASTTLAADERGHFSATPIVNGTPIRMLVDTGASVIGLSKEDAGKIGSVPAREEFVVHMSTANGPVLVAPIVLREVSIGDIVVRNVQAVVFPEGRLQVSLLGMSFLSKLSHFEISNRRLILNR